MEKYGFTDKVLDWFRSWINGREQRLKFNDITSAKKEIQIGLPQGTPLSCCLFNLYVNDVPNVLKYCQIKMFADDAMIHIAGKRENITDLISKVNYDLHSILNYLNMCKLKMNVEKTKYIIIGKEEIVTDNEVIIGGTTIEKVETMKYLGVIIDNKLNFKEHFEYVNKKMAKKVYFLSRMRKKLDQETKKIIYKSLVVSQIDYCSSILFMSN